MSEDTQNGFDIGLFECGDWRSCLCAYVCCPCALASARSHLDDSVYVFNILCLPVCCITPVRWMIRTAYDIPGDACSDCYKSCFCPCCVLNQLLQTAFRRGNTSIVGGQYHNSKEFTYFYGTCSSDCQSCIYSNIFCPCAVGAALQTALGMPYILGCCCVTPCAARNIIRYQYRLRGDDLMEEFCGPLAGSLALYGLFVSPISILPIISGYSCQVFNESQYRGRSSQPKYLVNLHSHSRRHLPTRVAVADSNSLHRDWGRLATDVDDGESEISSALSNAASATDTDRSIACDEENSPLLVGSTHDNKGSTRGVGALAAIPESDLSALSASAVRSNRNSSKRHGKKGLPTGDEEIGTGYVVAKVASSKDKRKKYREAEADIVKPTF